MSRVRQWNLSYGSLTSFEAREKLRTLKTEEPVFWGELTASTTHDLPCLEEQAEEVLCRIRVTPFPCIPVCSPSFFHVPVYSPSPYYAFRISFRELFHITRFRP